MSREMTMTSQPSPTPRQIKHRTRWSIGLAALTAFATTVGMCGVANATGPLAPGDLSVEWQRPGG